MAAFIKYMNSSINPSLVYRLQSLINPMKRALIVLPENPSYDAIAASLSLYLSLTQKGKEVIVASPSKITVSIGDLFAVDKISDALGQKGKNLIISFPYVEGSIEKVSYNIQNDKFNLVIEPRGEGTTIDKNRIEFLRGGEGSDNFDMVFYVDVNSTQVLGKLSQTIAQLSDQKPSVCFSTENSELNTTIRFGSSHNGSISEVMALVLLRIGLPFDHDISDNLLKAMKQKTNNFTQNVVPDTFEAAAICMRKQQKPQQEGQQLQRNVQQPSSNGQTIQIPTKNQSQPIQQVNQQQSQKAPPDWLKPKIFRSSDQVNNSSGGGSISGQDKGSLF